MPRVPHKSIARVRLAGGLALALWSGAASSLAARDAATNQTRLVWPAPPAPARIAFVQTIASPRDAGVRVPPLKKIASWFSGDDSANQPLRKPFAVAFDADSNLLVTDTAANTVGFLDRKEKKWRRWSKVGPVQFVSPVAVAKHSNLVLVADSALGAVVCFQTDGKFQRVITNGLERPVALTVCSNRLYVLDSQQHGVRVFALDGTPAGAFGERGVGPGEFNFPTHLAAHGGRLYVTDSMNGRVQILETTGKFVAQLGRTGVGPGQFSRPKGVALDAEGRAYVVDAMFGNVQIFDAQGRLLLAFGSEGQGRGEFWLPAGIAISPRHEIAVADSYNHRVQLFELLSPP